jgi:two-component system OmpR family response regulator
VNWVRAVALARAATGMPSAGTSLSSAAASLQYRAAIGGHSAAQSPFEDGAMNRCLVVDDDAEIRESVGHYLRGFGFDTRTAADGAGLKRELAAAPCDVLVLDIMLPGEDGLALLRWLRAQPPPLATLPVVMLTARGDAMSRVVGLELGADDYLPKPFEPRELVARLQAVLRRSQAHGDGGPAGASSSATAAADATGARIVNFAGWRFDRLARHLVSPEWVTVALSSAEFRLLSAFIEQPGRVLTRERLLDLTRAPGVEVNDRSIDLAVSRLRTKLGDPPREPRLIRTVRGEGYLFDAQVSA